MRNAVRAVCGVGVLLALHATPVLAAPGSGWAVFGGFASHSSSGKFTQGALKGNTFSITSSGASIGGDYQFGLNDNFSLNLFLLSSSESATSKELTIDSAGHGIFGAEVRFWSDEIFFGAHVGNYSEAVVSTTTNNVASMTGFGSGFIVGWESKGGLFVSAQVDQASIRTTDAESTLSGARIQVGYRWK